MDPKVWEGVRASGVIRYLSPEGDKRVEWTTDNWESIGLAHKIFREKIGEGQAAFSVTKRNLQGSPVELEHVTELRPEHEEVIFRLPIRGG